MIEDEALTNWKLYGVCKMATSSERRVEHRSFTKDDVHSLCGIGYARPYYSGYAYN